MRVNCLSGLGRTLWKSVSRRNACEMKKLVLYLLQGPLYLALQPFWAEKSRSHLNVQLDEDWLIASTTFFLSTVLQQMPGTDLHRQLSVTAEHVQPSHLALSGSTKYIHLTGWLNKLIYQRCNILWERENVSEGDQLLGLLHAGAKAQSETNIKNPAFFICHWHLNQKIQNLCSVQWNSKLKNSFKWQNSQLALNNVHWAKHKTPVCFPSGAGWGHLGWFAVSNDT